MATRAEVLFERLQDREALTALIGQAEDGDFDCKEWPERADAARGSIAKAACGFANATGGVIVIGVHAAGRGADTPDVVREFRPVADMSAVKSAALDIVLKYVEPGIEGVRAGTVPDTPDSTSGFVLLFIPATDGSPRRSAINPKEFYVRVASGTIPMEYFQIEDRFGRRPRPALELYLEPQPVRPGFGSRPHPFRLLNVGLTNSGRGVARFPSLRFRAATNIAHDEHGVNGNGGLGLPLHPSTDEWIIYRGGVDHVIYPGETLRIGNLVQTAVREREEAVAPAMMIFEYRPELRIYWVCEGLSLLCELSAEGVQTSVVEENLEREEFVVTVKPSRVNGPTRPYGREFP